MCTHVLCLQLPLFLKIFEKNCMIDVFINSEIQPPEGNLNVEIDPKLLKRKDEIGEICTSFITLRDSYRTILKSIHTTADELYEFSTDFSQYFSKINENIEQCTTAADAIAQGASYQAEETQNSNTDIVNLRGWYDENCCM